MKHNRKKRIIAFLMTLVLLFFAPLPISKGGAAQTGVRPSARELPDGTLIIGVYMIDFRALTVEIQKLAEESASANKNHAAQQKVFYKSELNSGTWYDITEAKDISEITVSTKNVVSDEAIDRLALQYYVKPDGSILSFESGTTVAASQLESKTKPMNMPELEPILGRASMLDGLIAAYEELELDEEDEDDREDYLLLTAYRREKESIQRILEEITDDTAKQLTGELEKMEASMKELVDRESIDAASEVKLKKRTKLELHCYEVVAQRLTDEIAFLGRSDSTRHSDVIGIDGDVYTEIVGKIDELRANAGSDTDSSMGEAMDRADKALEEALLKGDTDAVKTAVDEANALEAILDGKTDGILPGSAMAQTVEKVQEELLNSLMKRLSDKVEEVLAGSDDTTESLQGELSELDREIVGRIDDIFAIDEDALDKQERLLKYQTILSALCDKLEKGSQDEALTTEQQTKQEAIADFLRELSAGSKKEAEIIRLRNSDELQTLTKDISAYQTSIEHAHEKYREALEEGDDEAARQWSEAEEAIRELLEALYRANKQVLNEQLSKLLDGMGDEADVEGSETAAAMTDVYASLLSEVDQGLFASLLASREALEEALRGTDSSDIANAYNALILAAENADETLVSSENKGKLLRSLSTEVENAAKKAGLFGNERLLGVVNELSDALSKDILRAEEGKLINEPENNLSQLIPLEGTGEEEEAGDLFRQYELVCIKRELYLNGCRMQRDGEEYLPLCELAERMGSQVLNSGAVIVIRDEDFLLECEAGNPLVYVNDKRKALSTAPERIGDTVYVTAEFFAECYGMKTILHENTLILH